MDAARDRDPRTPEGKRATCAYQAREILGGFGTTCVPEHTVEDGKIIAAAGTSVGVEAGLRLAEKIAVRPFAEAVQLITEYDPKPVLGAGEATKAPAEVIQRFHGRRSPPNRTRSPVSDATR